MPKNRTDGRIPDEVEEDWKVEQDEPKSLMKDVKTLLSRLFGPSGQVQEDEPLVSEGAQEAIAQDESTLSIQADAEISSAARTISERVTVLRKTFEFDADLKSRLDEIHSARELFLYIHDVVLFRFATLRDIGFISAESSKVISSLNEKIGEMLGIPPESSSTGADGEGMDIEELRNENVELKQRIESLHAKYMRAGVISETELAKEQEIKYLQSKIREQSSQLSIARKRLTVLASYQEMVQSLRAKNSIITSKLEHQSRLLRSLTVNNPKQQELVSTIEKLEDENRRLKLEIEKQTDVLNQLKMNLPPDARQAAEAVIKRNMGLHADLEAKQAQLEGMSDGSEGDLLDQIERLTEQNTHLKSSLQSQQSVDVFLKSQKEGKGDTSQIVEMLKTENQRLEVALRAKEEQLQVLSSDHPNKQLLKAYQNLQNEYKQVFRESKNNEQLYQQEQRDKHGLIAQARERTALIKENQRLKAEIETGKRLIEVLRKSEFQCQVLRKERSEIHSKYERTLVELDAMSQKLAKITAEHSMLIKEYEGIFGGH